MIKREVVVLNEKGLHARAAAKVVNVANKFKSKIELIKDSHIGNAKSIISLLILAASQGQKLELIIDGIDEEIACQAILDLFNNKFNEEQ